jgi:hypothetical protein
VSQIPDILRGLVRERARNRCEYCLIAEVLVTLHEPDHIIAVQHRGATAPDNLALACFDCNRWKGPNISSVDPETGRVVPLFHPRRGKWTKHFLLNGALILGRTAIGRATVELLRFNDPRRVRVRAELHRVGRYP